MSNDPTAALAPAFDWTSAGAGLDVTVNAVAVTVATQRNVRMWLGKSASGTGQCLVKRVLAAINAAIGPAVMQASISTDGKLTFSLVSGAAFTVTWHATLAALFGDVPNAGGGGAASVTGAYPVKHLGLCGTIDGGDWSPTIAGAAQVTASGVSYGYVSTGAAREEDTLAFGWIIRDPTQKTALGDLTTPWHPADASLALIGAHACPWSWRDVLRQSVGRTCALARGNWQTLRTSTTETYDLVSVRPADLLQPQRLLATERWLPYHHFTATVYRQGAAPIGTRA